MKQSTPQIQVGKSGVTESLIAEIKAQLKRKKILKVRILKSARTVDRRVIAGEIAKRANANLSIVRGNTFTLTKR
jgi:RNA-binding protein